MSKLKVLMLCDFHKNCGRDYDFTEELKLRAFQPEDSGLSTFRRGRRLDWILISEQFEFVDHRVFRDELSDHKAVGARLRLR